MKLTICSDIDVLRTRAADWDDLWQRSEVALPLARAAMVALWIEQFAADAAVRILTVEDKGRLVAALPLVGQTRAGFCEVGTLPINDWSAGGELLLDPIANTRQAIQLLCEALPDCGWPLIWLRLIRCDRAGWQALAAECEQADLALYHHGQHEVGTIDLPSDWNAFEASWSGNHRRHMGKAQRRLEREGGAALHVYSSLTPDEVEPLLSTGFQIEDRSWKGAEGTSVLRTPGMFEFFLRQARQLAAWGQLHLVFLIHRDRPIAFEYGIRAKGTYFTPKVAFDPEFASCTPSQVLRYQLYQRMAAEPAPPLVDFLGPLADATSKWITGRYHVGTTLIAMPGVKGRALLAAYRLTRATRRRLRRVTSPSK